MNEMRKLEDRKFVLSLIMDEADTRLRGVATEIIKLKATP